MVNFLHHTIHTIKMNTLYKLKHKPTGLYVSASKNNIFSLGTKGFSFLEDPTKTFNSISTPYSEIAISEFELVTISIKSQKEKIVKKKIEEYVSKYKNTNLYEEVLKAVEFGYNVNTLYK